jgi:hypothetical protein
VIAVVDGKCVAQRTNLNTFAPAIRTTVLTISRTSPRNTLSIDPKETVRYIADFSWPTEKIKSMNWLTLASNVSSENWGNMASALGTQIVSGRDGKKSLNMPKTTCNSLI